MLTAKGAMMLTKEIAVLDDAAWGGFAGEALGALILAQSTNHLTLQQLAKTAADYADAMMIEREKRLPVYLRTNTK